MKASFGKPATFLTLLILLTGINGFSQNASVLSAADELKTFYDITTLPAYRSNTITAQTSTYDTTSGNNDGFEGNYSFIRRNRDSSLVIFDIKGTGVVNRIWTPTPTTDTLDFYIDDTIRPVLSICYTDLFSGNISPFVQPLCGNQLGGYFCYYPILFQKQCRIVSRGKRMQFHQIQYRLYKQGTTVKPFTTKLNSEETAALQKIKKLWDNTDKNVTNFVQDPHSLHTADTTLQLRPGDTKAISRINKGGTITGIELSPADAFEGLYKDIFIRIRWDDEMLPAVDCPVADFFGFAFGRQSMQSLLLGSANKRAYCYFPMPFDKKASIELFYEKRADTAMPAVQITATVSYTLQPRQPQLEGKLYTHWQQNKPDEGKPHIFLDEKGKGHYVATILQAQGLQTGMTLFFEGDDSTVIDGEMRLHGTGSEDYFNGGWYALTDRWDTRMSLPLHGALDYSLIFSRTGGYRLYLSDKLSFEKSIYHTIEHGPEQNKVPVLYTSVCFYYSNTPVSNAIKPEEIDTKVLVPDTLNIYPQFTKVNAGENMVIKTGWDNASIGQSFDMTVKNESNLRLSLEDIPPGHYKLFITYVKEPDGCRFSLWQRQSQLSSWINTNAATKSKVENALLSTIDITELNKTVTIRFKTDEVQNHFILSKLMLVKSNQ